MNKYTPEQLKTLLEDHRLWWYEGKGKRADLRGADLRGADLSSADLSNSVLRGADLRGAVLQRAVLRGADLSGADLSGADLSDAVLRGADLSGADLQCAVLRGADLSGAVLTYAKYKNGTVNAVAQVSFTTHGECGRQLMAIRTETETSIICGCFTGSPEDLEAYIAKGPTKYQHSRRLAMRCVLEMVNCPKASYEQ